MRKLITRLATDYVLDRLDRHLAELERVDLDVSQLDARQLAIVQTIGARVVRIGAAVMAWSAAELRGRAAGLSGCRPDCSHTGEPDCNEVG